jgi:hypothetical protein
MKKVLFLFFFLISCSASTSSSTELEPNSEEESVIVTNTTLSTNDTHDDHDHHDEESHDDHEEEAHDDHDEETPKPISLLPFDYYLIVPDGVPDKLEVLNYNLGEETVIHFEVRGFEKEIHVHGYDIHFMVYPNQDNILKIELTIAGEFEIEDHDSGYEFARLIVSP